MLNIIYTRKFLSILRQILGGNLTNFKPNNTLHNSMTAWQLTKLSAYMAI